MTATKKPSVSVRRGVISRPSAETSAAWQEQGGALAEGLGRDLAGRHDGEIGVP